jgi:hypothetical protein
VLSGFLLSLPTIAAYMPENWGSVWSMKRFKISISTIPVTWSASMMTCYAPRAYDRNEFRAGQDVVMGVSIHVLP